MLELEDDELFVEEICRLFASKGGKDDSLGHDGAVQATQIIHSFLVCIYICAFYTAVIGAAITEQLYKFWEEHPGVEVPTMKPMFYGGPWRVYRGEVPRYTKEEIEAL